MMAQEDLDHTINELTKTLPKESGKRLLRLIQWVGLGLFLTGLLAFNLSITLGEFQLTPSVVSENVSSERHQEAILEEGREMMGRSYGSIFMFIDELTKVVDRAAAAVASEEPIYAYNRQVYRLNIAKAASRGIIADRTLLYFWLSIGLACLGALIYMIPKWKLRLPGIDHDGIFQTSMTNLGWLGITTGFYLIAFYVLLYWYPEYLANWIKLVDPLSMALKGQPASQWFLYGFLYTLAIVVMGVRMFAKYRHSTYHKVRTASVMFFQTAFAFLIPEILVAFNKPYYDFKNIWPLDYDFFFDWQLNTFLSGGSLGIFMLVWGTLLTIVGVPVMTYFFGKRWYCSWVCGCGGLAETLGDPYRQLSDKSLGAWKFERWSIHSVLVFVSVMTALVLYHFFTGTSYIGVNVWLVALGVWAAIGGAWYFREKLYESVSHQQFWKMAGTVGGIATAGLITYALIAGSSAIHFNSYGVRQTYGFAIGSVFAGVIGVGFYPTLGSRPWCRFGCPLAAYLGLIQRFKSRFRITTNGGQCISCGNCSTYCEMGIDVRWYAQRGQNIVRSSCVGCGVCSSVCPRGVLRLENGPEEGRYNEPEAFIINEDGIKVNF